MNLQIPLQTRPERKTHAPVSYGYSSRQKKRAKRVPVPPCVYSASVRLFPAVCNIFLYGHRTSQSPHRFSPIAAQRALELDDHHAVFYTMEARVGLVVRLGSPHHRPTPRRCQHHHTKHDAIPGKRYEVMCADVAQQPAHAKPGAKEREHQPD